MLPHSTGLGTVAILIIMAYVAVVVRYPEALKHWVSTITITVNHAQTYAILGGLGLEWPESVRYLVMLLRKHWGRNPRRAKPAIRSSDI